MTDRTPIKEWYTRQFTAFEESLNGEKTGPVHRLRRASLEQFAAMDFPTARIEEWKHTSVDPILKHRFEAYPAALPDGATRWLWTNTPSCQLVFVNGRLISSLSRMTALPDGVQVAGLGDLLKTDPDRVAAAIARMPAQPDSNFTVLNGAFMTDGAFVFIPDGVTMPVPVHLIFLSAADGRPLITQPRVLIAAGRHARVSLTESYGAAGKGVYFTNAVTQMSLEEGAHVDFQKIQDEDAQSYHIALTQVVQERSSSLVASTVTLGGAISRQVIHNRLDGEGIEATLNGLFLVSGTQHADHRTLIDHAKPHCNSHELYKGILDGTATAVFNGKIIVRTDAQKTDAKQSNNNLLLSPEATINTKPQLEIFADDVKCTHGATIGRLDDDALFYLRSRGLNASAARAMLTYAFAGDMVERIPVEAVRARLDTVLKERMPH